MTIFDNFQFIRPYWLLAIIPFVILAWFSLSRFNVNAWQQIVDSHLLSILTSKQGHSTFNQFMKIVIIIIGIIAIIALAGPAWDKQKIPVFKATTSYILLLDLSKSMDSIDLKPSRIAQAKYKIKDFLATIDEAEVALIAFAADAFTVSPLTDDKETITALLDALEPDIMPAQGSNAGLAIDQAIALFKQSSALNGNIIIFTDDVDSAAINAANNAANIGHTVSVLGIGTPKGAPIQLATGDYLKNNNGQIIIPKLNTANLISLANAGNGMFSMITTNNSDIESLVNHQNFPEQLESSDQQEIILWQEQGPWLLLLILPFISLIFRRGWILTCILFLPLPPSYAFEWNDLWQRQDQQAIAALQENNQENLNKLNENSIKSPMVKGSIDYKLGNYENALSAFKQIQSPEGLYNKANTLAKLGKLEEALSNYEEALAQNPNHENAQFNKKIIEDLLKQQQQEQNEQDQENSENKDSSDNQQQENSNTKNDQNNQSNESSESNNQKNQANSEHSDSENPETRNQQNSEQETNNEQNQPQNSEQESTETDEQQLAEQAKNQELIDNEQPEKLADELVDKKNQEEQQLIQQKLRAIPDDPAGLLRRKFLYQYQTKQQQNPKHTDQPW